MNKVIILLLAMVVSLSGEARTIRDFFANEPGELFKLIPKNTRLDLLDYFDNGQVVLAKNDLGNGTSLIAADSTFIALRASSSKMVQMLLVAPSPKDSMIVVIETYNTPVLDSHISFYDEQWRLLVNKYLKVPTLSDFVRKGVDKKKAERLLKDVAFPLISLSIEGDNHDTIVATHGLDKFLVAEEYKPLAEILEPSLTYTLRGMMWKLKK